MTVRMFARLKLVGEYLEGACWRGTPLLCPIKGTSSASSHTNTS